MKNQEENKLLIGIENKNPVSLPLLTVSLLNLSEQFSRFLDRHGIEADKKRDCLFIRSIQSGSIHLELYPFITFALPLLQDFNTVYEFSKYIKNSIDFFIGKSSNRPCHHEKKDLEQISKILDITANDYGSNITFVAIGNSQQTINFNYGSTEAKAAQHEINKQINELDSQKQKIYPKELLTWYQARFDPDSITGDKAVIESISRRPIKVIFDNDSLNQEMINIKGFSLPWQKLAYIVDVDVSFINDAPKIYKITNFYPQDTFDPSN